MTSQEGGAGGKGTANPAVNPPGISLPKGGGAIRGIGEKFAANPVTGTGSMTVPVLASPGRSGFGPQLNLSYDTGSGNGPFGFGWSLSLPSITRKTDKGLPQYHDGEDSDVFILSGAEDLVPCLEEKVDPITGVRCWIPATPIVRGDYAITRYRPRVEGLFARIERWVKTSRTNVGDVHWRSISKDNVLTVYGRDANSRIFDPADPTRVFSWLICESYDDKGNAIVYEYAGENGDGVDRSLANEHNRARTTNRYLKRIHYGNRRPLLVDVTQLATRLPHIERPDFASAGWMFEVVFDYGEGHYELAGDPVRVNVRLDALGVWPARQDPFSGYRAGFEVRTYRLCHRVLMFHHFPAELGAEDYLVRSTEFEYRESPIASFITRATQSGYTRRDDGSYLKKSLPPLELEYSAVRINDTVHELDADSAANLPTGLDGALYQWVDLDGEGLSGVLTEQAEGWYYKRNLSPLSDQADGESETRARFTPLELVATKPSTAELARGRQQFLDLAGDGQLDLVQFSPPLPGYYERTDDGGWEPLRPFRSLPNVDWGNPDLKFVDLTGDGHADILMTEAEALTWHPSLAEDGFGPALRLSLPLDEERGPRLVFSDGTQSIYLADMSGDGLTDLVRIRSGEVCYWPNLGYGRFGAKVTMDATPRFDSPDQFDQQRIRLADVDGSGMTDILYLGRDRVQVYFNQSGNGWAHAETIPFPHVDNLAAVQVVDLLGNGTACLVWSSPLAGEARAPMRYIDLMGGQKPHLLVRVRNNLGAETEVQYAPSTRFYLADKLAGKPWITRLPFPVHCIEKVTVRDRWRGTTFSTSYSYHHGYFDGPEREFRGFGRVDQVDVESYGTFAAGNIASPYITSDRTLYQPPLKTITWYHTGAMLDRERILSQFNGEYFPNSFEALNPERVNVLGGFQENLLPEPDLAAENLSTEEWREALRACKGMLLRQEIYELDVDALEAGEHRPVRLFSTAYHNCHIRRLQERAVNRHAVFLVTESEAITYHYELDLRPETVRPDPRVAHTLNLRVDEFGNMLQSVAVVYSRFGRHVDASLPPGAEAMIARVQQEMHIAYTEAHYTNDVIEADDYRLRVACETKTYELTGLNPQDTGDRGTLDPRDDRYFTLDELRAYRLSEVYQAEGILVSAIDYHALPDQVSPQKRLVEHVRTLYFAENLNEPLSFGALNRLGLTYETYKLALTEALLSAVFASGQLTGEARAHLSNPAVSGYLSGADLTARFPDAAGQYWLHSGTAGFESDAAEHFYLPERYTDPFGNLTRLRFDPYDLFLESSTDPAGNTTRVEAFDFRTLAPRAIRDINDNLSEVVFDTLGMPAAMAMKGKGSEGDSLDGFDDALLNPDLETVIRFFTGDYNEAEARRLLGKATARYLYYLGETVDAGGAMTYGHHPACAGGILREKHVAQLGPGELSRLQVAFEYSDGVGTALVKKMQAEPETEGGPLRWIASGKTILNNKGKPVKQYEPYFSPSAHRFEEPVEAGVTPIMYYDAVGRLIRTEQPDGAYSRVEFSPWHVTSYDANDTVLEPGNAWYARHTTPTASAAERRAAELAAAHAATPATTFLDSLGREVVSVAHNKYRDRRSADHDEKYVTLTKLDAEGKPLWIRDPRGNLVMQYIYPPMPDGERVDRTEGSVPCYDIVGNLLFQHSMDAGDRWTLADAAGKPMYGWDVNDRVTEAGDVVLENRVFHTTYDALHRPLEQQLKINDDLSWQVTERFVYGETHPEAEARNLRGQVYQHYDSSGLVTNVRFDFKGNLLEAQRQLASDYRAAVLDWPDGSPTSGLETEIFTRLTEYDALNRMARLYNWRSDPGRVAVYEPRYNQRGLLEAEDLVVRASRMDSGYAGGSRTTAISGIAYNAKGQRERIQYGNGTTTRYDYDALTFRLRQLRTTRPGYDPIFPDHRSTLGDVRVVQQLYYTYDPVGNIAEIHDDAYEPAFFNNQRVEPRSEYTYDALYRLVAASGRENYAAEDAPGQFEAPPFTVRFPITDQALRNYTQFYTYDPVGNILEMRHSAERGSWTRDYEYAGDSNRLLRTWTGGDETAAVNYGFDRHGSLLNLANVSAEDHLRWDYRDMIHSLNLGGGGWAYYNYDSGKGRTRKVITNRDGVKQWERLYLGGMEMYRRYDVRGDVVEEIETHHLFADDQRVLIVEDVLATDSAALDAGTLYRYQYSNHLGSVGLELSAESRIISYEEYHPYGTAAYRTVGSGVRAAAKRYRYTGMERDEESGLSYHTARYYAPWLGRWVSTDPVGVKAGLHVYEYAYDNPANYADHSGKQPPPTRDEDRTGFPTSEAEVRRRLAEAGVTDPREIEVVVHRWRTEYVQSGRRDSTVLAAEMQSGFVRFLTLATIGVVVPVVAVAGPEIIAAAVANPGAALAITGSIIYGLVSPPGAPDLPGPGDELGRVGRAGGAAADDFARGADDIARGADDVMRGADDLARGADDMARGGDDAARELERQSAPHVGSGSGPRPRSRITQQVADAGPDRCVGAVCAIINNSESRGFVDTVRSIERDLGRSLGRLPNGRPNPAVATPSRAISTIERATGLAVSSRTPASMAEARAAGHYAIFFGDSHVIYGSIGPNGRVSILDATIGRGWSSWSDFLAFARTRPALYGSNPALNHQAYHFASGR